MIPSGVAELVELIWHFTGYLRLQPNGVATVAVDYNGDQAHTPQIDPLTITGSTAHTPAPQALDSAPSLLVDLPDPDDYQWHIGFVKHAGTAPHYPHADKLSLAPLKAPPIPQPDGDGDGSGGHITFDKFIVFQPGGDQELIDLHQANTLHNDDNAAIGPFTINLHAEDSAPMLTSMLGEAAKAVPAFLTPNEPDTPAAIQFVDQRDSHEPQTQMDDAPYVVSLGKYVNGELQDPATDIHQTANDRLDAATTALDNSVTALPAMPTGDHSNDHIQTLSLGSNTAANDALIASDAGLSGSLLVLGNSYATEGIFQTNDFVESNHFGSAGGEGNGDHVTFTPNLIQNAAEFSETGAVDGPWMASGPLFWSVDVLNGSLYDVKAMSQMNYISDNDVVSQTQSTGYSQLIAGSNEQFNAAQFENLSAQYDLIIVGGNYHRLDLIYQTNVVLDANHAWQGALGSGDGGDSQNIDAGNNALLNDATITFVGADGSQNVTDSMLDLVHALENQTVPDQSLIENAFPNLAGVVHVLFVQGDYYDINYLAQTNVISDANTAAQMLTSASGQQSMSTGNDQAINVASIVDGGSLTTPYVQGTQYSDSMLLQTNIITQDPKITTNDPAQLAPEVIAFTGQDAQDHPTDAPQIFTPTDTQHQNDVLAGTLH
jgi:hypothetical protein